MLIFSFAPPRALDRHPYQSSLPKDNCKNDVAKRASDLLVIGLMQIVVPLVNTRSNHPGASASQDAE